MYKLPKNIEEAISEFQNLPGIGLKTAERMTFYLLKRQDSLSENLGNAIFNLKKDWKICSNCFSLSDHEICSICNDDKRDKNLICVVGEVTDLIAIEKTGEFSGVYHILGGTINPFEGIGPDEIRIMELKKRVKNLEGDVEVIIATNPNIEGEATAMYVVRELEKMDNIKVTKLARGLPAGGDLEYADGETLSRAITNRTDF